MFTLDYGDKRFVYVTDVRSSIREDILRALPPDVADWTVQNVVYYFKAHGYIQESKLLEDQVSFTSMIVGCKLQVLY